MEILKESRKEIKTELLETKLRLCLPEKLFVDCLITFYLSGVVAVDVIWLYGDFDGLKWIAGTPSWVVLQRAY